MNVGGLMLRARRALEFGRHIPVSKMARRVELHLRRKLRARFPSRVATATPARRAQPLEPLFAPASGMIARAREGYSFTFIGRTETMSGQRVDWNCPGPEPRHQLWRMNLHYMEYLEETDDVLWAALVEDWIDANPSSGAHAWKDSWNSYAISLRCVVWMNEMSRRGSRLPENIRQKACASLAEQMFYLEHNLETDIGGNHLIKNIKALVLASAFFEGPEAERWRTRGLALLDWELPEQVLPDGVHYERSPSYHCQVFADFLEVRRALGAVPHRALDKALGLMAQATANLCHPDGYVSEFNDAGLTMAYTPAQCLEAYAALFGARPVQQAVFAHRHAGYFGLRTANVYCVADCGRVAPDDLPAHGHSDVLSFELSVARVRVVVDQGVFEYFTGPKRQMSRAASAHNTLALESVDQADFFGSFRCGRRPNVELREWTPGADGFVLEGAHDGFRRLPGAPRHVRRFEAHDDSLVIRDRIEGATDRAPSLSFLLHPQAIVTPEAQGVRIACGPARLTMEPTLPVDIEDAIWWPDMGVEQKTIRLRLRFGNARQATTTFRFEHSH